MGNLETRAEKGVENITGGLSGDNMMRARKEEVVGEKEVKEMLDTNHDDSHNIGKTQNENHKNVIGSHDGNKEEAHDDEAHYEHVLQQMQNRPWAAIYVATFFFFIIVLGVLTFYAIQYASQAGWSPVLFRVMEGITAYLPIITAILFILLLLSGVFNINHMFFWMNPDLVDADSLNYDKIIA